MHGSRGFCQRGSNFDNIFFSWEDPNTTKSRPPLAHQRNTIKMVFRWRAVVDPTLNAGLDTASWFTCSRGSGPVLSFRLVQTPCLPLWIYPWLNTLMYVLDMEDEYQWKVDCETATNTVPFLANLGEYFVLSHDVASTDKPLVVYRFSTVT